MEQMEDRREGKRWTASAMAFPPQSPAVPGVSAQTEYAHMQVQDIPLFFCVCLNDITAD